MCASLLQCVCFKVKQNFSSKNFCPSKAFLLSTLSFPPQIVPVLQTTIDLDFVGTFSPHIHPHTFSVIPPNSCLWLTLIPGLFHAGTARLLEKVPECYKLRERQCEIPSNTTATNQNRVQPNVSTAHHQMSPDLWSVSCPHFSHLFLQLSVC